MTSLSSILSVLKTLLGILIPPIKKKFFDQPKLYLVIKRESASKTPKHRIIENNAAQATFVKDITYINDLAWKCNFIIRNNTEFNAYNIKLILPQINKDFILIPELDSLKPLLKNSEREYTAIFRESFEGKGSIANEKIKKPPRKLTENPIVLEYTNSKGTKFYTIYNHKKTQDKRNEFKRKIDKKLTKNFG